MYNNEADNFEHYEVVVLDLDECFVEDHYNWEDQDYSENKVMYEYHLEHLEELPKKEKTVYAKNQRY